MGLVGEVMGKRFSLREKTCDSNGDEICKSLPIKDIKRLAALICFFCAVFFVRTYLIQIVPVLGDSMNPTLTNGDVLLAKSFYGDVERYDIVVAKINGQYIIKRVIGLPREVIQIQDGSVCVDGAKLETQYEFLTEDPGLASEPFFLGEDEYFLMGDNRSESCDSREFGAVKKDQLTSVVLFRMFPLRAIG